jgi:hypothetical protein
VREQCRSIDVQSQADLARHARGEYEIGHASRVCVWDGSGIDRRSESEREEAALGKAARLAQAFSAAVAQATPAATVQAGETALRCHLLRLGGPALIDVALAELARRVQTTVAQ